MRNVSRCREYLEGRVGRYHTFTCLTCGRKFRSFLSPGMTIDRMHRFCSSCDPSIETVVVPILRGSRPS